MLSTKLSLISQIALLIYIQVIEWVNLFPWNDIRHGNGQAGLDIAIGAVMTGAIIATLRRLRVVMAIAAALYSIWLWLQINTWWVGYFAGASPTWKRTYARFFSQTVQLLPRDADHLPPDACHICATGANRRRSDHHCLRDYRSLAIPSFNFVDAPCGNWPVAGHP